MPEAYKLVETKLLIENSLTRQQLAKGELMNDVGSFAGYYTEAREEVKSTQAARLASFASVD